VLGKECNCSCVYCHQASGPRAIRQSAPQTEHYPSPKEVVAYFKEAKEFRLILYGGEPLLYWPFLEKFLHEFRSAYAEAPVGVISNGTLLDKKIVSVLNAHNVGITLSHDGKYHAQTRRHKDILKEDPDLFLAIKNKSLASVCSAASPDFYGIWDYFDAFSEKHDVKCPVSIQIIKDVNGNTDSDLYFKTKASREQFEAMLDRVFDNLYLAIRKGDFSGHEWQQYSNTIARLNDIVNRGVPIALPCGEDSTTVDIDVFGNLYRCHNVCTPFGHVGDHGLKASDKPYVPSAKCLGCSVYALCGGLCYVANDAQFEHMCFAYKAQAVRIMELLTKLQSGFSCV
jgi:radical SAM protein with 4Fe4S-binding SPASM domain